MVATCLAARDAHADHGSEQVVVPASLVELTAEAIPMSLDGCRDANIEE